MKVVPKNPPREFRVGKNKQIVIRDCGDVHLEPDEMVTFVTSSGAEYDVGRKDFGYYATPSLNGRLPNMGFRAALVRNEQGFYFVMLVEKGLEEKFFFYLEEDSQKLVCWLDQDENLARIADCIENK